MNFGKYFFEIVFISSLTTNSERFREFDARNTILLQIKVSGGKIKETTQARYLIKVIPRPSFTR